MDFHINRTAVPAFYPWPLFLTYLTGVAHVSAGVAIATGIYGRLAALLAGIMFAIWTVTLHLYRVLDNLVGYAGNRPEVTALFVCLAFTGAALVVAASFRSIPTNGRSSQPDMIVTAAR